MNTKKKHAFLIIAHEEFELLELLIRQIDHPDNDIFIHVDLKAVDVPFNRLRNTPKFSKISLYHKYNIMWGGFRLIQAELFLFEEAFKAGSYSYYHLLSGSDLLIRPMSELHGFFRKHEGLQFMDRKRERTELMSSRKERFMYYYLFNNIGINKKFVGRLNHIVLEIQKKCKIDRYRDAYEYGFGSNWVSLTQEAAEELLLNRKLINRRYRFTYCCDEVYKQTILTEKKYQFYKGMPWNNLRYIIWPRDDSAKHPKLLTIDDYDGMMESQCFFARKFSLNTDKQIIDKITEFVL